MPNPLRLAVIAKHHVDDGASTAQGLGYRQVYEAAGEAAVA